MKKTIFILSILASSALFAESPIEPELPTNPCLYIADAGCHIGPNGEAVIEPYDICDTHGICEVIVLPEEVIVDDTVLVDLDEKFVKKQAKMENKIAAKYAKLEIYKECVENATNVKSLKVCKKNFKKKSKSKK